jgi:hypothetical protein
MGKATRRKPYYPPTVTRLTPEEAKIKLVEHARNGDGEAMDLLKIIFPEEAKKLSEPKTKSA